MTRTRITSQAITQPVQSVSAVTVAAPPIAQPTVPTQHKPKSPTRRRGISKWWGLAVVGLFGLMTLTGLLVALAATVIYSGGILPRVSVAGVALGGMNISQATEALQQHWQTVTLRDGDRTWQFEPQQLGLMLDAAATAQAAYTYGRQMGNPITAIFSGISLEPVMSVDAAQALAALDSLTPHFAIEPVNASVSLRDGQVQQSPAQPGRLPDMVALVQQLEATAPQLLAQGFIDLPMQITYPTLTDITPLMDQLLPRLAYPISINVFDPIDNTRASWSVAPEQWGQWLSTSDNTLTLNPQPIREWLTVQQGVLSGPQYIDTDAAVADVQAAFQDQTMQTSVRVRHYDTQHTVQPGETITSIAWDYGVPYPWLQQANPQSANGLNVGQSLTIPSADHFFDYPVVPDKRIIISLSQQRTRVYENDQIIWDWVSSTGMNDSPTWPGIYQIISHVPDAYAANWNLNMPYFLGIYRPIPGQDFTNGFHGFPSRGGNQILWTNNLGTRVTYGCILLDSQNARQLYDWAENGVVVEIIP